MQKIILSIVLTFALLGCISNSKVALATEAKASVLCPGGIGAREGSRPNLEVTTESGWKLILCGSTTESEFDVYSVNPKGKLNQLMVTHGALEHFRTYEKDGALILDELIYHNGNWIPAFRNKISCESKECVLISEGCIFKRPRATGSLAEIRSYQTGKNKGKGPDEMVIQRAADLALAGNKEAQDIFFKSEAALSLDGHSSETFHSTKNILLRLRDAECL